MRKKHLLLLSLSLLLFSQAQATLKLEEEILKITPESGAKQVQGTFTLQNTGKKTIRLTKLQKTCGCQNTTVGKKKLEPGEKTTIQATVQLGRATGKLRKTLRLHTKEEGEEKIVTPLIMEIYIPPVYHITPQSLIWEYKQKKEPKTLVFEVLQKEPVHILDIKTSNTDATAKMKVLEKGRKYKITLTPIENTTGNYGTIDFTTNCKVPNFKKARAYYVFRNSPVRAQKK